MSIRIWEQADRTGDKVRYSWLLSGVSYHTRKRMEELGWKWIRGIGCKGVYSTSDADTAKTTADHNDISIMSNGTHAQSNCPLALATS